MVPGFTGLGQVSLVDDASIGGPEPQQRETKPLVWLGQQRRHRGPPVDDAARPSLAQ